MKLSEEQVAAFRRFLFEHYTNHARHTLPWRLPESDGRFDVYKIWVSEIMLQQTQAGRVIPKFEQFIAKFPTVEALATAKLRDVLVAWQGLGYNRRAKFLWQAAQLVMDELGGKIPATSEELVTLPGIGHNTAGAIMVYAYNRPALFVETNVRSVYFHHFFEDQTDVSDKEVASLLEQTIDRQNPRNFYWALMDYGTSLKKSGNGSITRSRHYTKQSKFEGSVRQIRGKILRLLAQHPWDGAALLEELADQRAPDTLEQLVRERMVICRGSKYQLA